MTGGRSAEFTTCGLCLGRFKRCDTLIIGPRLKAQAYDCVVIGAGIRLPPHSLSMFEAVINAVHRAAPDAAIAFNTRALRTAPMLPPLAKGGLNSKAELPSTPEPTPTRCHLQLAPIWRLVRLHGYGKGGAGPSTGACPSGAAAPGAKDYGGWSISTS
jgi:hypothetical protein